MEKYGIYCSGLRDNLNIEAREKLSDLLTVAPITRDDFVQSATKVITYLQQCDLISKENVTGFIELLKEADIQSLTKIRKNSEKYQLGVTMQKEGILSASRKFKEIVRNPGDVPEVITDIEKARYNRKEDRIEFYQTTGKVQENALGVCIICHKNSIVSDNNNATSRLVGRSLADVYRTWENEPFSNQICVGIGSGFLVRTDNNNNDRIFTAGHIYHYFLNNIENCRIVFGYKMVNRNSTDIHINNNDIYCVKDLKKFSSENDLDYAVLQVDRSVQGYHPLQLSPSLIGKNEEVYMIGHPCGLPLKATGNAKVLEVKENSFTTLLTSYGGNSGSPVFKVQTHEVVGILISGREDFELKEGRYTSIVYSFDNPGVGERVCHISLVQS